MKPVKAAANVSGISSFNPMRYVLDSLSTLMTGWLMELFGTHGAAESNLLELGNVTKRA